MASNSSANIEHGVLVRQWKWPLRVLFWWATIALFVWVSTLTVHWYWARHRAPEYPLGHAQAVLQAELHELAKLEPLLFDPIVAAGWISRTIHEAAEFTSLVVARAIMNWPTSMRRNAASDDIRATPDPGGDFVRRQFEAAGDGWLLVVTNTGLFAVRTSTYLCALPLLGLGMALGATDGLVARAKRKACAGHESASVYHRAKLAISFVAILAYVVYLALPSVMQPVALLMPVAITLSVLVRLQCAFYKKYL